MVTEVINLKLDNSFLKEIDSIVSKSNYQNRTEFIRAALREKVENIKLQESMIVLSKFKGMYKNKGTTDEDLEKIREIVTRKLYPE